MSGNRRTFFTEAKVLTTELGRDVREISSRWAAPGSTTEFWRDKVIRLRRDIRQRERAFNRAARYARENRIALTIPALMSGTNASTWNSEYLRLRRRVNDNPVSIQAIENRNQMQADAARAAQARQRAEFANRILESQIDNIVQTSNWELLFSLSQNGMTTTRPQAERLVTAIVTGGNWVIKFTGDDGVERIRPINETTFEFFVDFLQNGYESTELDPHGSDKMRDVIVNGINSFSIRRVRIRDNGGVAFFPLINTTTIDLKDYQIFTQQQINDKELQKKQEHCLIHTLNILGIPKAKVSEVKLAIQTGSHMSRKDFKKIAEIIKRKIVIHMYPNPKSGRVMLRKESHGKGPAVNVAIFKNHCFPLVPTACSKPAIRLYNKTGQMKDRENICEIRPNGKPRYDSKLPRATSLFVVKTLHDLGLFDKGNMARLADTAHNSEIKNDICLDNIFFEQKECERTGEGQTVFINKDANAVNEGYKDMYCDTVKEEDLPKFREQEEAKFDRWLTDEKSKHDPNSEEIREKRSKPPEQLHNPVYYADTETFTNGDHHELFLLGAVSHTSHREEDVRIYQVSEQCTPEIIIPKWLKWMVNDPTLEDLRDKPDFPKLEKEMKEKRKQERQERRERLGRLTKEESKYWENKEYEEDCSDFRQLRDEKHKWKSEAKRKIIVYFHNLKYDLAVLCKYLQLQGSPVKKDGSVYSVSTTFQKRRIDFRCSYKIIPMSLSKFGKTFELPENLRKKEAIAYRYYTPENAHISKVKTSVYREFLKAKDQSVFDEIIKTVPSYDGEYFDPIAYYRHYLKYDCLVLRAGFIKFSHAIEDITSNMISVYDCLSISSLTDKFAIQCGAYRGVHEVCGNLREYIGRAVYGGRVHVNTKYKKKVLEGRAIADYDGVSLYPSAIHRLCREQGFPMGLARRFNPDYAKHLDTWREKDYAVLTVRIKEVRKNQQMPFIAHRGDGVIDYLNKAPAEPIVIDKTTLEDYIEFHDVVYEVLDGVYWNSGFNKRMGKVVETLFNARLEAKAAENDALQNTLKLMLNSAYGKTVLKKSNVSYRYVTKVDKNKDKKDPYENYIAKNFKTIRCITPITDELHEIESITADVSYNRAHIGCSVLSMSKRIMNEVMDIANSNDIPIFYQDTDSMHMYDDEVEKLKQAYGAKYGRELDGKQLGQFHVDFDLDGAKSKIVATKSIFLGKKAYIDKLESKDEDDKPVIGHHIRMKGVNNAALRDAKNEFGGPMEFYEHLAKGKPYMATLNPTVDDCMMEHTSGGVRTRQTGKFKRLLKF